MSCENCKEFIDSQKAKTPKALSELIARIKVEVSRKNLLISSFWPTDEIQLNQPTFSEVKPNGPWEDVLIYYFKCPTCEQQCKLSAETYHGSGGSWQAIKSNGV